MTFGVDKASSAEGVTHATETRPQGSDPGKGTALPAATTYVAAFPNEVRTALEENLKFRIADVGNTCQRALDVVAMRRAMAPTEQPSWFAGLLFDVLLGQFTSVLLRDFVTIRASAMKRVTAMELHSIEHLGGVKNRILAMETGVVAQKLGVVVAKVKGVVMAQPGGTTKGKIEEFVRQLKLGAAVGFTALRESLPEMAADPELLAYYDAFAPERHEQATYEEAYDAKISRYLDSGVTSIGRNGDNSRNGHASAKDDVDPWAATDVRVAWANYRSGYPPQLVYQHASARASADMTFGAQGGVNGTTAPTERGAIGDANWRKVPLEFADIALQRHLAMWHTHPTTVDVDDLHWTDDMIRIQMSYRKLNSLDVRLPVGGANAGAMTSETIKPEDSKLTVKAVGSYAPHAADATNYDPNEGGQ